MPDAITGRLDRLRTIVGRATLLPLIVRVAIAVSGYLAMTVAWPLDVSAGRYLVLLALVAVWPAVAPRGRGATVSALVVVAGWILDTTWYDARIALWRVLVIATLLYIGHTLTALAAVLPYDALVNLDVVGTWLLRALGVVLISAVLTVVALSLTEVLAGPAFVVATLLGLAAATAATLLLPRLLRRA